MYKKAAQGWLKHWDFILLDIICLQIAFIIAYFLRQGGGNPYADPLYRSEAISFILCQIVVVFFSQSYQGILKRGYYSEFTKTVKHVGMVMLLSMAYLFVTQQSGDFSRIVFFITAGIYLAIAYIVRILWKKCVLRRNLTDKRKRSMVLVVASDEAEVTIQRMLSGPVQDFTITGIAFMDDSFKGDTFNGIPVIGNIDTVQDYLCREWVDEVFVKVTDTEPYPRKLIDEIVTMGLTVHLSLGSVEQSLSGKKFVEKIGDYTVVTSSINTISPKQMLYKRVLDITGGIVGCLATLLLIVIIGPMIYIKSPGPIFFSQVRIAESMGCFEEISFVDNDREGAIGKLEEVETFYPEYNCAIAACDDGTERLEWNKKLETLYNIPVLFHMDSTISPSANLMPGCIVEPRAVVGCGSTIGQATVIGANTVVEPYSFIGDSCTLKSGTIVKSTSVLEMGTETEQGTVLFTPLEKK